jgi:putative transposase
VSTICGDCCGRRQQYGRREVLSIDIGPSEAETFWEGVRRRLRSVKLIASDADAGVKAVVRKMLNAGW